MNVRFWESRAFEKCCFENYGSPRSVRGWHNCLRWHGPYPCWWWRHSARPRCSFGSLEAEEEMSGLVQDIDLSTIESGWRCNAHKRRHHDPDDVVTYFGVVNSSVDDARLIVLKWWPDNGHRRAKTLHFNYNYNYRLPTKGHGLVILDQQGVWTTFWVILGKSCLDL